MPQWPASSNLVALGGCKLHIEPAAPEAGLAEHHQHESICALQDTKEKVSGFLCFFLRTLALSASPSVAGHDIKPGGTTTAHSPPMVGAHALGSCGLASALHRVGLGLGWARLCLEGSRQLPDTRSCTGFKNGLSQYGVLQLWHFIWCCRGQEALNAWVESFSIAVLIRCATKRIPFPFPAPAHPPVSPSLLSSRCGMEPSLLTETQQCQGSGKTMLLG